MGLKGQRARQIVTEVVRNPRTFESDPIWGELARELLGRSDADGPRTDQLSHLGHGYRRSGPRADAAGLPGA